MTLNKNRITLCILSLFIISQLPMAVDGARRVTKTNELVIGKCSYYRNTSNAAVNPKLRSNFVAMRWDYERLAKDWQIVERNKWKRKNLVIDKLNNSLVRLVHRDETGAVHIAYAFPADWGPHERTGRTIDMDRNLMEKLNCETDDIIASMLIDTSELADEEIEELVERKIVLSKEMAQTIADLVNYN